MINGNDAGRSLSSRLISLKLGVFTDFIIYACSAFVLRGLSFISLPIIMRLISPAEYGLLSLIVAFNTVITAVAGLGLRQVISLEYFHTNDYEQKELIYDCLSIYTYFALPFFLFLMVNTTLINKIFFFNQLTPYYIGIVLINALLFFYTELIYQLMQYRRQTYRLITMQLITAFITSSSSIAFIVFLNKGIAGIITGQLLATVLISFYAFSYLKEEAPSSSLAIPSLPKTIHYIRYGLPFIGTIMANWILSTTNRWMLGYYCSLADIGIYASADIASQLFYAIILVPWAGSYLPYIMEQYRTNSDRIFMVEKENKKIMWLSMAIIFILISAGLPIVKFTCYHLLPAAYQEAVYYVWFLLVGQIFLLGTYFCSSYIQFCKQKYFLAIALFVPALLNILLNFMLTPSYQIMGSTISTLISYIIYFMMTYLFNTRLLTA